MYFFIAEKPYVIGRLSNGGIEIHQEWHPELERYFESNFVLIHEGCEAILKNAVICQFGTYNTPTALAPSKAL